MTEELTQIFELALTLRTPVYELLERMSFREFLLWNEFLDKRPLGWRDDLRAFKIMCSSGNMKGMKAEDIFPSIAAIKSEERKRIVQPNSAMAFFLRNARGGAKLDYLDKV